MIPQVLNRHGDTATGRLNMMQYSDEKIDSPAVIFTPSELLNAEKPAPEEDENSKEEAEKPTNE